MQGLQKKSWSVLAAATLVTAGATVFLLSLLVYRPAAYADSGTCGSGAGQYTYSCDSCSNATVSCSGPRLSTGPEVQLGGGWCSRTFTSSQTTYQGRGSTGATCTGNRSYSCLYTGGFCQSQTSEACSGSDTYPCGDGGGGNTCNNDSFCGSGESTATCPTDCPPATAAITVTANPPLVTIVQGQTTTIGVTVSANADFSGPVALSATGCPSGATCVFSVSTVTLSENGSQSVNYIITNTGNLNGYYNLNFTGTGAGVSDSAPSALVVGLGVNNSVCSALQFPRSVTVGQQFSASIVVANTGTRTWKSFSANPSQPHRLGSQDPLDNQMWGLGRVEMSPATVAPGHSATFTFNATAPQAPGSYMFSWRMLQEFVEWFGPKCADTITVTAVPAPPTVDLQVNPWNDRSFPPGTAVWLQWITTGNPTSCTASGAWAGAKQPSGGTENTGPLAVTKTYTITCTNDGGSASDTETVTIGNQPVSSVVLIVNNQTDSIVFSPSGDPVQINWDTQNVSNCVASGDSVQFQGARQAGAPRGPVNAPYELSEPLVYRGSNYRLAITCAGPSGLVTDTTYVQVDQAPQISALITANGTPNSITIPYNTGATIAWTSSNATSCSVSPTSWGGVSGSQPSGNLVADTVYSLTCSGPSGTASSFVSVHVQQPGPKPSIGVSPNTFTFTGTSGGQTPAGQSMTVSNTGQGTLNWVAQSVPGKLATWCSTSVTSGTLAPGAAQTVSVLVAAPSAVGTFSDCGIRISDPNATNNPQDVSVTYTVSSPQAAPVVSITANGTPNSITIPYNTGATIAWNSTNAVSCAVAPHSWTGVTGSRPSGNLTATTAYTATCTGPGGTSSSSVTVNISTDGDPTCTTPGGCNSCVNDCGGGPNNFPVIASAPICEKVSLTWGAGAGATQYRVYRGTTSTVAAASVVATVPTISYQDSVVAGTAYYYWVETVGGTGNRIAANTNSTGGVTASSCAGNQPENPNTKNTSSDSSVLCGTVKVTWQPPSAGPAPTGYRVYRSSVENPYSWQLVSSPAAGVREYTDSTPLVPAGPNYYAVSGMTGSAESAKAVAPSVVPTACAASLDASDKDIIGVGASTITTGVCNGFQAPPSSVKFELGQVITYAINLCNSQVSAAAKNIVVTDQLTNSVMPAGGWQARYQDTSGAWVSITPSVSGTVPNQVLTFTFPATFQVPAAPSGAVKSVRKLEFKATLAVPSTFTGSVSRFQDRAVIRYDASAGVPATVTVATPLLPFGTVDLGVDRKEVTP